MKKFLLLTGAAFCALLSYSQPCSDVFISEIVEGWSNNKAVEIYNPTTAPIDISTYGLVRFQNGSFTYGEISYLNGVVIAPGDVFVVVLDKRDSTGTQLEAPVWDELWDVADTFINPLYDEGVWPMYFNGDDAVALVKNNGNTLVDIFGKPGEGEGFGGWGPLGTDPQGDPMFISLDHTLVRKSTVQQGVTVPPTTFDILAEWDSLPANTFDHLGWHNSLCIVGVEETEMPGFSIYPNPATAEFVTINAEHEIVMVRLLDFNGRIISAARPTSHATSYRMEIADVTSGTYFIEVFFTGGLKSQQRIVR